MRLVRAFLLRKLCVLCRPSERCGERPIHCTVMVFYRSARGALTRMRYREYFYFILKLIKLKHLTPWVSLIFLYLIFATALLSNCFQHLMANWYYFYLWSWCKNKYTLLQLALPLDCLGLEQESNKMSRRL